MEIIYPPINSSLKLGVREADSLKNKYIFFIPRILDIPKSDTEAISKIFSATQEEIKKATTPQAKTGGDGTIYIGLPIKSFSSDLDHEYSKVDVFVGSKAKSMLKTAAQNIGKNAVNAVVESELGTLLGLDKLKNTFLAQAGVAEYKPQKNLYQSSSTNTLDFSWAMSPRTSTEALVIYKIFKLFQFFSMPQEPGSLNNAGYSPFFIKNPAIWKITFADTYAIPDHLFHANNEYTHMVLKNVKVSFGGGDDLLVFIQKANSKSFPVEITLQVSFDYYMDVGSAKDFLGVDDAQQILSITI